MDIIYLELNILKGQRDSYLPGLVLGVLGLKCRLGVEGTDVVCRGAERRFNVALINGISQGSIRL